MSCSQSTQKTLSPERYWAHWYRSVVPQWEMGWVCCYLHSTLMWAQARFAEEFTNIFSGTQTRFVQLWKPQPENSSNGPATTRGHCLDFRGGWVCFYSFASLFVSIGQSYRSSSRWWVSTLSDGFHTSTWRSIKRVLSSAWPIKRSGTLAGSVSFLVCRLLHHLPLSRTLNCPPDVNWTLLSGGAPPRRGGAREPRTHGDGKQRTAVFGTTARLLLSAFPV